MAFCIPWDGDMMGHMRSFGHSIHLDALETLLDTMSTPCLGGLPTEALCLKTYALGRTP